MVHPESFSIDTGSYVAGLERPGREADYSPSSSAAFKNECSHNSIPLMHYGVYMDFNFSTFLE